MLKTILYLHIAGGTAALLSMVIPLVTPKGARTHRRSGWVFVGGMTVVSITALLLSGARFFFDPRPDAKAFSLFLFYIAILTGQSVASGISAIRAKDRATHAAPWWDIGLASVLMLTSVGMAGYGIATGYMLFTWFSILGFVNAAQALRYWLRPPAHRMHWWFRHMTSMLGSCIAAVTAFLVVNAPLAGVSRGSLIVWITPGVVGGIGTRLWVAYYRRRFAGARVREERGFASPVLGSSVGAR